MEAVGVMGMLGGGSLDSHKGNNKGKCRVFLYANLGMQSCKTFSFSIFMRNYMLCKSF